MPDNETTTTTHEHQPGRVVGIVISVKPRENGKVFIFLRGPDGQEYFSHISGWQVEGEFYRAALTQPVSFKVTMTPSGKRAWDVRAPTEDERAAVAGLEDQVAAARANEVRQQELTGRRQRGGNGNQEDRDGNS